jgi:hypothetical protein
MSLGIVKLPVVIAKPQGQIAPRLPSTMLADRACESWVRRNHPESGDDAEPGQSACLLHKPQTARRNPDAITYMRVHGHRPGLDVVHVYLGDHTLLRHNRSCADQNTGSTRRQAVTRNR